MILLLLAFLPSGVEILNRIIRVDHTKNYRPPDDAAATGKKATLKAGEEETEEMRAANERALRTEEAKRRALSGEGKLNDGSAYSFRLRLPSLATP